MIGEASPLLPPLRAALEGEELIAWSEGPGENEFALFRAMFDVIDLRGDETPVRNNGIYAGALHQMVRLHARRPTAHVLFAQLGENWGAFSTTVPNRTADWGDWRDQLGDACSPEAVRRYLDDPAVKAVVTTQHMAFDHPTIVPLPLGVRDAPGLRAELLGTDGRKTEDLLLNNSGWGHRRGVNERVVANFGGRLRNSYGLPQPDYYQSVARARFVLCPSGIGWDSYRVWETLALGSIPIVEYSPGWHRVLDDLPALFVTRFDEVTPALLASAYARLVAEAGRFDYGKLTRRWWARRIAGALA